jgi:molybdopterin synthase catalytic subunit
MALVAFAGQRFDMREQLVYDCLTLMFANFKGDSMNISKTIAEMKNEPGFFENVGMILVHNGVVRGWSRSDRQTVTGVEVSVDGTKVEDLRKEYQEKPGIYRVVVDYRTGLLHPGDDVLFIVVAGDIRENVKPVLADLLDRIKAEAVTKKEIR